MHRIAGFCLNNLKIFPGVIHPDSQQVPPAVLGRKHYRYTVLYVCIMSVISLSLFLYLVCFLRVKFCVIICILNN